MTKKRKPIVLTGRTERKSEYVLSGCPIDVGGQKVELEITDDIIRAIGQRYIELCLTDNKELEQLRNERKQVQQIIWSDFDEDYRDKMLKLRELIKSE